MGRGCLENRKWPGCSAVSPRMRGGRSWGSELRSAPGISKFRVARCCLFHLPIPTSNWHLPLKSLVQNLWLAAPRFCQMLQGERKPSPSLKAREISVRNRRRNRVADPASLSLWLRSSLWSSICPSCWGPSVGPRPGHAVWTVGVV